MQSEMRILSGWPVLEQVGVTIGAYRYEKGPVSHFLTSLLHTFIFHCMQRILKSVGKP